MLRHHSEDLRAEIMMRVAGHHGLHQAREEGGGGGAGGQRRKTSPREETSPDVPNWPGLVKFSLLQNFDGELYFDLIRQDVIKVLSDPTQNLGQTNLAGGQGHEKIHRSRGSAEMAELPDDLAHKNFGALGELLDKLGQEDGSKSEERDIEHDVHQASFVEPGLLS